MNAYQRHIRTVLAVGITLALGACSRPNLTTPTNTVSAPTDSGTNGTPNDDGANTPPKDTTPTPEPPKDVNPIPVQFGGLKTFGVASSSAREVQVDQAGNVYVTGSSGAAFDGQTFSGGESDVFLVKFSAAGELLWTRLFGSVGNEVGIKVVPTTNGNVFVAGTTTGSLFAEHLDASNLSGRADLFLTKLDADGNQLWGKQFGSNGVDSVSDMRIDANGDAIVSGVTGNTFTGAQGTTGKGAFVTFAGSNGTLTSTRFYDVGQARPSFVKMDYALNVYVTATTDVKLGFCCGYDATWINHLTKFSADSAKVYTLSSPEHYWKAGYNYFADSNGIVYLEKSAKGDFQGLQRFDNTVNSWETKLAQIYPYWIPTSVVNAQSISNTDTYAIFTRYFSRLVHIGAGGAVIRSVQLPSSSEQGVYTYPAGFNLDRQGNIYVTGDQRLRDADGNFQSQLFVVKYNSDFVIQ